MRELFGWLAKNVLTPMLPFLIGAVIRAISGIQGVKNVFDVGELSFSMAMLCLFVLTSASRVTDKSIRDSLTAVWVCGAVIFLVLFAVSSFAKVQIESSTSELLSRIQSQVQSGPNLTKDALVDHQAQRFIQMLDRVWSFVVIPAVATLVFAIACKFGFRLED